MVQGTGIRQCDSSDLLSSSKQYSLPRGNRLEPDTSTCISTTITVAAVVTTVASAVPVAIAEKLLALDQLCSVHDDEEDYEKDTTRDNAEEGQMIRVTSTVLLGDMTAGISNTGNDDKDEVQKTILPLVSDITSIESEGQELIFSPVRRTFGNSFVRVIEEPSHILKCSPRTLNHSSMQALADKGLPLRFSAYHWERLFSISRDGDSFHTMLANVKDRQHTLFALKTTNGETLGGFVSSCWESSGGLCTKSVFYGSGQAFLFSFSRSESTDETEDVNIFKWTGINGYVQLCDEGNSRIAMGGEGVGGKFGLCVDDSFYRGTTGCCDTFGNKPLAQSEQFEILEFELYGFRDGV